MSSHCIFQLCGQKTPRFSGGPGGVAPPAGFVKGLAPWHKGLTWRFFCDRPTATVIIRNMEKQGWVSREPDEQDRRQVRVVITAAGRARLDELAQVDRQGEEFDPLGCFDEAEIAELDRLLGKMNEHLKQIRRVQ